MAGVVPVALLAGALKGSVVLAMVALLCTLLRGGRPSLRAWLWLLAVVSYPVCALVSLLPSPLSLPVVGGPLGAALAAVRSAVSPRAAILLPVPPSPMPAPAEPPLWPVVFAAIWIAGVVVGGVLFVRFGAVVLRRLAGAERVRGEQGRRALGIAAATTPGRRARVLHAPRSQVPFARGFLRPTVVLPTRMLEGSESDLRAVVAHELAHARRRDPFARRVAFLGACVFWFVPLTWLALRRLHAEQEKACDEAAVASGVPRADYARTLVTAMRATSSAWAPGFGARPRALARRARHILRPPRSPSTGARVLQHSVAILAVAVVVPFSLVRCTTAPTVPTGVPEPVAFALAWPLAGGVGGVTSPFGRTENPFAPGTTYQHRGIDIAWERGTPVLAAADGTVQFAGKDPHEEFGNNVVLGHASGYETRYAHLQGVAVKAGELVTRGQKIGTLGNTGLSTGYHLHFELTHDGVLVDPRLYMQGLSG